MPGLLRLAISLVCLVLGARAPVAAADPAEGPGYRVADFSTVAKIDAHVHLNGPAGRFMAQAIRDNFRVLTINVDYPDFPPAAEQSRLAKSLRARYPDRVAFVATISVDRFASPDWAKTTLEGLGAEFAAGAVGVKMWKNIGMALKDPDGRYVMPDDPRLAPVIAMLEREHVVLLGHQAEPLNCWLPFDQMTVRSDRKYFSEHPQYYMYRHPEMPSHEAILAARDRMLSAHPRLKFDGVHLASLEWDVDRVAAFLDRFPEARVDVAARMVHLEHQAARDRDRVRAFLIRYADRVLYGSDLSAAPREDSAADIDEVHAGWLMDWRFLVSAGVMHSKDFKSSFRGLELPRDVVDKIYRRNAEALFPAAWRPSVAPPKR